MFKVEKLGKRYTIDMPSSENDFGYEIELSADGTEITYYEGDEKGNKEVKNERIFLTAGHDVQICEAIIKLRKEIGIEGEPFEIV